MRRLRTGSKRVIRDINRTIILNLIKNHRAISRADLIKLSSLGPPTVSDIVRLLLDKGLITETDTIVSTRRGPRPVLLELNPKGGAAVGVMIRPDGMNLVITDLSPEIVHRAYQVFPPDAGPDAILAIVAETIKREIERAGIAWQKILGLGVAVSGVVDSLNGVCRNSYILGWHDVEVGAKLRAALDIPIHVENDALTLTIAEHYFGLGQNHANFILVTVGRGVGMGVLINGELLRGDQDQGTEFGHVTMALDGPACLCGKRGCLEAITSDVGITQAALTADSHAYGGKTIEQLTALAEAGDERLRQVFAQAGVTLGIAVANLINIFGPELLVLTGEGLRAGTLLLEPFEQTLPRCTFGKRLAQTELVYKPWDPGWEPWARGAASLVLDDLLRAPIYERPAQEWDSK